MKNGSSGQFNYPGLNFAHQYHPFWPRHADAHALAKFPFGDTSSALSANMWNQMNVKKLGSTKLKLVDFRIESKTEVQRVEFADTNKEPAVTEHCFAKLDNTAVDQIERQAGGKDSYFWSFSPFLARRSFTFTTLEKASI